jgi:hypothetical protein
MANELRVFQNYLGGRLTYDLPAATTVVTDGATTNADATVTSATAAFTAADVGAPISGTNIPAGAYIISVTNATTVEISANATATGSGITLTIDRHKVMHSAALGAMSLIGTTQHMMVGIDPDGDGGGAPEIAMVTKHDASAAWAQITRAQESTAARLHRAGEDWVHGPLATDVGAGITEAVLTGGDYTITTTETDLPNVTMTLGRAGYYLAILTLDCDIATGDTFVYGVLHLAGSPVGGSTWGKRGGAHAATSTVSKAYRVIATSAGQTLKARGAKVGAGTSKFMQTHSGLVVTGPFGQGFPT